MNHFIQKFLDRYLSAWIVLIIDTLISVFSTGVVIVALRSFIGESLFTFNSMVALIFASVLFSIIAFWLFRSYRGVIRYASLRILWRLVVAVLSKSLMLSAFCNFILFHKEILDSPSISNRLMVATALDVTLSISLLIAARLLMIAVYDRLKRNMRHQYRVNVLIYGTDAKSAAMVTRLQGSPQYNVVGFLTSGKSMKNHTLAEHPIYHFTDEESLVKLQNRFNIEAILFAAAEDARNEQDNLVRCAVHQGVKILISSQIDELPDGKIHNNAVREINIEDLLGREEIEVSMDDIVAYFRGKTVLVTGAAGSIGSELCRLLATLDIKHLILFDNAETPVHNVRLELEEKYPNLIFTPIIGDVRSLQRLDFVFRKYCPQIVFHAAAYKHVPLMEENPCEAVLVNVIGSKNVADKCIEYDVEKMIMISTDKAVNPTNIMGCTKRLAEIYVQSLGLAIERGGKEGNTKFVTTRFGNVLGSNGSVIPRFKEQIAKGGPVTVTHSDITRFFMTIPEACRLVMEAAIMSNGSEIFVFDMGEPVRIAHLAERMIDLAGLTLGKDIQIEYTGLRPGEKLYEEVLSNGENTFVTNHERIRIAKVRDYDYVKVCDSIDGLQTMAGDVEIENMVRLMKRIVPEFVSQNSEFSKFDKEIKA